VTVRSCGVLVAWGERAHLQRYGGTASAPWQSHHVSRLDLDAALLERARTLGAVIWQPCWPRAILTEGGRVCGLETTGGTVRARWVADATGRAAWLARRLRLETIRCSPPLVSAYGYVDADSSRSADLPRITADADGWTWHARISSSTEAWVRTTPAAAHPARDWVPPRLRSRSVVGPTRYADVGWRFLAEPAGPGYVVVGDAAALLDPSRSSGVIKALIAGITAATSLTSIVRDGADENRALGPYRRYVRADFAADSRALSESYAVFPWWTPLEMHLEGETPWHSSTT